jgi:hypothetical protein
MHCHWNAVSMTDGNGATQYSYVPVGSLGALRLRQEQSPLANSAIHYGDSAFYWLFAAMNR